MPIMVFQGGASCYQERELSCTKQTRTYFAWRKHCQVDKCSNELIWSTYYLYHGQQNMIKNQTWLTRT